MRAIETHSNAKCSGDQDAHADVVMMHAAKRVLGSPCLPIRQRGEFQRRGCLLDCFLVTDFSINEKRR